METPTPSSPVKSANSNFLATVVVSVIIGGLTGGLVSYSVWQTKGGTTSVSTTTTKQAVSVQESSATIDVVKKANPAVVSIIISQDYSKIYGGQTTSPYDFFFGQQSVPQGLQTIGSGSGFVVSADGMIVTNKHVVSDTTASYSVVMNDGKKYDAKVLALDPVNDVAVLKIDAKNLPVLTFADSNSVQIGQAVIAIGNALGEYKNTVTEGIISGSARSITAGDSATGASETIDNVFQTDAAINPGNSGGPLLDLTGNVIAINTAVNSSGQSIGFAIPANVVSRDVTSVQKDGKITAAYLGVRYVPITQAMADQNKLPVNQGALVQKADAQNPAVVSGSPADKAGLVENDIITAVNGTVLDDTHSLAGILATFSPGDTVTFTIYHGGVKKDVKIVLGSR